MIRFLEPDFIKVGKNKSETPKRKKEAGKKKDETRFSCSLNDRGQIETRSQLMSNMISTQARTCGGALKIRSLTLSMTFYNLTDLKNRNRVTLGRDGWRDGVQVCEKSGY